MALSDKHDVYNKHLKHLLLQRVANHVIAGIVIAPPCETWSEARHLEVQGSAPRPLRSSADPLLTPALTKQELEQCQARRLQ